MTRSSPGGVRLRAARAVAGGERAAAAAATARGSKEPEERPPPRAPGGGGRHHVATDVAVELPKPRRSSSLKDAPEFTAALAAWRHPLRAPTVGVSDTGGAPADDVFRV